MNRKYKHFIVMIFFLKWLKDNSPDNFILLEQKLNEFPLSVALELMDALIYYKSKRRALKVLLNYYRNREDYILMRRVNDLALWARTWNIN